MKKINNIIYLFILAIGLVSCENDINSSAEGEFTATNEVTIGFTDTNDNMTVLEDGGTVTFDVALSKGLPVNAVVEMSITSSDGSLNNGGVSEVSYSSATINAGSTTASFTFTFADDTLADNSENYTVTIGNVSFEAPLTEMYLTQNAENGTSMRTITVVDTIPVVVVTTPADVVFNFTWAGGSDLDCRIRDSSGGTIDTGYSITPGESVTLGQADPDGEYILSIRPWTVLSTSVSYSFDFVSPAGTETFDGTLENAPNNWAIEIEFLKIDKVTNGAVVTYTLTKL